MKKILVAIAITAIVTVGISVPTTWYLTRCEDTGGTVEQGTPGPLSPTVITDNTPAGLYCGDHIDIHGAMRQGNFFVTAQNKCMSNTRSWPMTARCPASYRPYSIMIQPFIFAGYSQELARFNALAGINAAFLWNYRRVSLGFGVMYAQGLIYDEYYVGASFVGKIDFGKLKTIGE